ncbi:hypothetical protein [Absidia glauca]|uniref:Uncharacterized protein n=1 Tax=Absidia glauca TaxID=4829 RepID=A0A163JLD4_ABSGL|nr:hypothetical protein [Absidia glauca]
MLTLSTLGLNSRGYAKLLSVRLYQQFLRPQMEYGLAITHLGKERMRPLEQVQDTCLRRIFEAHDKSSTKVQTPPALVLPATRCPTTKSDHDNHDFCWPLSHEIVTLDSTDTTRPLAMILNRHPFAADQALFKPVPRSLSCRTLPILGPPTALLADWWYPETMSVRHNHHQKAHHRLSPPPPSPLSTTPHPGSPIIPAESLSSPPSLPLHHCQMEAALADHPGRIADPGTATTPRACRTSTCSRGSLPGLVRPKSRPPFPQGSRSLSSSL